MFFFWEGRGTAPAVALIDRRGVSSTAGSLSRTHAHTRPPAGVHGIVLTTRHAAHARARARGARGRTQIVAGLRAEYNAGTTRPLEWRRAQLYGLVNFLDEQRNAINQAVWKDLHKASEELYIAEVLMARNEAIDAIERTRPAPRRVRQCPIAGEWEARH